jgi:cell shape-determining protein MreD
MAELLFYPIMILLLILQMVVVRHLPLFNGTADLLLLWLAAWGLQNKGKHVWIGAIFTGAIVSFVSAVPWYANLLPYLFIAFISRFLSKHFWQNPLIALLVIVFIGSLVEYLVQFGVLSFLGTDMNFMTSLKYIIVPSIFLNLILAIPIYVVVNDMAQWVYPIEANE